MNDFKQAIRALTDVDCLIIGAGAGLSAAAGLTYSGERFARHFAPFIERYGMSDMYSAGFYPFASESEKWAYWAEHIYQNRLSPPALPLYQTLFNYLKNKEYFIITTNVDAQFEKAGFANERIFAVQGDYGKLQCATACHDTLYDNADWVKVWREQRITSPKSIAIPYNLIPKCPVCGNKMAMHLRIDRHFVQNSDWHTAQNRYAQFVQTATSQHKKVVLMELGVGFNTPTIIRYPFEQMTYHNPNATLIRVNQDYPTGFAENAQKTLSFDDEMAQVLEKILQN